MIKNELIISGNAIHYLNLQGMVGIRFPNESGMYFDGNLPDESLSYATVEMVTLEELIKIAVENMKQQTEASIKMHKALKKYWKTKEECEKKWAADDIVDTGGMLF